MFTLGYDANGNMTTRTVSGSTYTLGYDYENRLTSVSGAATATFTFDGDGNRVKSVVGSTTTLFVGSHYESSGGVITKYYLAGGAHLAMRKGSTFYWLLSDHLGSTSKVATSTGALHSQQLYKAWGETRYTSGTLPTRYTYTGQYSYASDFGLVFYGSRFYDPLLGRFASPDSIIPQNQGTLAWDRYAYVNNSPLNYTDPTGHDLEQIIFNKTGALPKSQQPTYLQSSRKTPQPTLPPRGLVIPNNNFPTPENQSGFSDPALEAWFIFWDNVALPFFYSVEAYDVYRFTSKGGYRAFRYALPTGLIEAGVAGFQQYYRDTWYETLSPGQRFSRPVIYALETYITDRLAGLAGGAGGAIGASSAGPVGAFLGFFAGNALVTTAGDRVWADINQNHLSVYFGAFP